MILIHIDAPHFSAGIEYDNGPFPKKNRCAHILRYMEKWDIDKIFNYCLNKGYRCYFTTYGPITATELRIDPKFIYNYVPVHLE